MRKTLVLGVVCLLSLGMAAAHSARQQRAAFNEANPLWNDLEPGPFRVGFQALYRIDPSRFYDSASAIKGRPIRIMIWYPAEKPTNKNADAAPMRFGDYANQQPHDARFADFYRMLQERDQRTLTRQFSSPDAGVLSEKLRQTPVAAFLNATPAKGKFPLVVHSTGRNNYQLESTILWEYLASHGYVVATIPQLGFSSEKAQLSFALPDINLQRQDAEFALMEASKFPNADLQRVAAMGHSSGGVVALMMAAENRNIDAVASLDGELTLKSGIEIMKSAALNWAHFQSPVITMYRATDNDPIDFSLLDTLTQADRYYLAFAKSTHFDFQNWPLYSILTKTEDARGTPVRDAATGRDIYLTVCRSVRHFLDSVVKKRPASLAWFTKDLKQQPVTQKLVDFRFQKKSVSTRTYALTNGQWFNGRAFERKTFYSVNGIFTAKKPDKVDAEINLNNKFVVPPFAEAHNHNLGGSNGLEAQIARYLKDGVFYSKNMHYVRELTAPIFGRVNNPSSVDVAYAHSGLTVSGGHAVTLYEMLLQQGVFPGWKKEDLDTRAFFIIDDENDLEKKWSMILAGKPDFIKTYLEYSEEYEQRKADPKFRGQRGLNPKLLPLIVKRAHAAGLRVSAHIETAADFHQALIAGVDEIAHLPGYQIPNAASVSAYQISDEDAQLAARNGVFVITTTALSHSFYGNDPQQLKVVQENQVRNLRLLQNHRVKIALGSDTWNATSLAEAMNLSQLKVFDHLTLLKLWCEVTPQTIFPKRKLGLLQEGYEASFLTLEGNPLEDFTNVKKIVLRFKQGELLDSSAFKEK